MKHKTEDYKLSAVKYYLKHKISMKNTCDIFECSKKSLSRWYPLTVQRFLKSSFPVIRIAVVMWH